MYVLLAVILPLVSLQLIGVSVALVALGVGSFLFHKYPHKRNYRHADRYGMYAVFWAMLFTFHFGWYAALPAAVFAWITYKLNFDTYVTLLVLGVLNCLVVGVLSGFAWGLVCLLGYVAAIAIRLFLDDTGHGSAHTAWHFSSAGAIGLNAIGMVAWILELLTKAA